MFEGTVAYLLNKFLGKYIQNLDSSNLNVSIFSGKQLLLYLINTSIGGDDDDG